MNFSLRMMTAMSVFLFCGLAQAKWYDLIPSPTGNYCKDQAIFFIENNFVEGAKITKWFSSTGLPSAQGSAADVKTNFCSGWFQLRWMMADSATCKRAHYVSVPRYLTQVRAKGDCKRFLPQAIRPSLEEIGLN